MKEATWRLRQIEAAAKLGQAMADIKLAEERRRRNAARSYLQQYIKRGLLKRQPCERCGEKAQAHHTDYSKPLVVRWLCGKHHNEAHHLEEPPKPALPPGPPPYTQERRHNGFLLDEIETARVNTTKVILRIQGAWNIWRERCPLKIRRAQRELTLDFAAAATGISRSCLWQIEAGGTRPRYSTVARLRRIFGEDIGDAITAWRQERPDA